MVTPQLYVKVVSSGEQALLKGINEAFDGVADAGGSGTFETIQAADDFLGGGAYALWVKSGTYAAGFTVDTDTNNAYIYIEPGTVIEDAITLSGAGITLVFGAQCDIQGLITVSGANCSILCQNGVDMVGVLASGASFLFDGGGWDTLINGGTARKAFTVTSADGIIKNFAAQTTAGGGNSFTGIEGNGVRQTMSRIKIVSSDHDGIVQYAAYGLIEGCMILGADRDAISIFTAEMRVLGNYIIATGQDGIRVSGDGDNSVIVGNIVKNATGETINLLANGDNCVVVANRVDGAVSDSSTGSTVANNDATAF